MQMPARQAARIASRSVLLARRLPLLSVLPILREPLVGAPGKLLGGGVEADLRLRDQGEQAGDDGAVQVLGLGVVLGRLQFLGHQHADLVAVGDGDADAPVPAMPRR